MLKKIEDAIKTMQRLSKDLKIPIDERSTYSKAITPLLQQKIRDALNADTDFPFSAYGNFVDVRSFEEVQTVRGHLRRIFGTWHDAVRVFHLYDSMMCVRYTGEIYGMNFFIDYNCDKDDLPEGILKAGCRITYTPASESTVKMPETYAIVCEAP